jgi:hypothetical protein
MRRAPPPDQRAGTPAARARAVPATAAGADFLAGYARAEAIEVAAAHGAQGRTLLDPTRAELPAAPLVD